MNIPDLLAPLRALHEKIRAAVVASCEASDIDALARVAFDEEGDTIYAVDRVSEELLVEFLEREIAPHLIGERYSGKQPHWIMNSVSEGPVPEGFGALVL